MSAMFEGSNSDGAADGAVPGPVSKVLLVDDHPAIREAVALVIGRNHPDLQVCGQADSLSTALDAIGRCHPDLAVVDVTLKHGNGLELTERILALHPHVRVVIYSMHDPALYAARARRVGAWGYVSKEHDVAELLTALRRIRDGRRVFPEMPNDADLDQDGQSNNGAPADVADLLSDRELEVLQLLGEGQDMNTIADRMQLSVKTVETYRARLKKKLGITRRAELIRLAVERSLDRRRAANIETNGDGDGRA
jgi:DNA-binding NarL/FixJ family response regulator